MSHIAWLASRVMQVIVVLVLLLYMCVRLVLSTHLEKCGVDGH